MSRKILIFDTTLRDGEQAPGFSMDFREKVEVALQLEKLKVDVIEAGFAVTSPGDLAAIRQISASVKDCAVASLSRAVRGDVDASWEALKDAAAPRIHIVIATSPLHMEYKLHMTPQQVLERTADSVAYAKTLCSDVQFSAEDACRSDREFLARVLETAIMAGATTVSVPDTVGYITPTEMYALVKYLRENVRGIENVTIAAHCHNDLGMGTANSLGAVAAGAGQVECTVAGIGERAGNTPLEEVVMALKTRASYYEVDLRTETRQIYRTSRLVSSITGAPIPPNKAVIGSNAFSHESGIHQHGVMANRSTYEILKPEDLGIPEKKMVLGKHSGRHAFEERLKLLGHELSREEMDQAFERFKVLADKKKTITDRDIDALFGGKQEVVGRYSLDKFVINSGNSIHSTAVVEVFAGEDRVRKVALGEGPVDAAFKAINKIAGREFTLENYTLSSVTEGEDALGEALVRISLDGRIVTGRGVSTDVIEASIKAYINGVNKMVSEG